MEHDVDMLKGVILPFVNFFVFLALAIYFFRKPARDAALKHREDFVKQVKEATAARDEALARLALQTSRQQGLDKEIAELKLQSRQAAEAEAAKIVADAERLAAHLQTEARRIAEAEVLRARNEIRQEIVAAVREGAAKRLANEINADTHLSLVRKQIHELQSIKTEG